MGATREELEALDQYHQTLALRDPAGQASLLRNGFLPASAEGLIEAGIRCIPLVESGATDLTEAAVDRLSAIRVKLKLLPETPAVRRALEEIDARVAAQKQEDDKAFRYGCMTLLGLALVLGGAAALIVYFLTK